MKAALFVLAVTLSAADLYHGEAAAQSGDFQAAIAELRPLAEQGSDEARVWLGGVYFRQGNYEDAQWWLSLAAGQGHAVPMVFLSQMYQDGKGVEKNYIEAYKWLVLASQRDRRAIGLRERLASKLTPAEIVVAERLAAQWKPEPLLYIPKPRVSPVNPIKPSPGS